MTIEYLEKQNARQHQELIILHRFLGLMDGVVKSAERLGIVPDDIIEFIQKAHRKAWDEIEDLEDENG